MTTIAPTGTLSIIANASSGVEPLFAVSYVRTVMDNDRLVEVNPLFEEIAVKRGFYSRELMQLIADHGSVADIDEVPSDVQRSFVTAHDIAPSWHIRMQAAFQKYTDNAVSKTVNFASEATADDVRSVYDLAYDLGVKGVTIYRDGSKQGQVLTTGKSGQAGTATRGASRASRRDRAAPEAVHHRRPHREDPDRLRQPLRHGQLGRSRHVRGVHSDGQVRRMRGVAVGGALEDDLGLSARGSGS